MTVARLLPRPNEEDAFPIVARPLFVRVANNDEEPGLVVRNSLRLERTLTSLLEEQRDIVFREQFRLGAWPTRDNPFLSEVQKARLDADGLLPVGTILQTDDVVASILTTAHPDAARPNHPGLAWVRDGSLVAGVEWDQMHLTEMNLERVEMQLPDGPQLVAECLYLTVRAERELSLGDLLFVDDKPIGIVSRFADDLPMPADILVPRRIGEVLGHQPGELIELPISKSSERSVDALQTRSVGPYSIITFQPLGQAFPGQLVSAKQIHWLLTRGFRANVGELTSLKSDDLLNRNTMRTLAKSRTLLADAIPEPASPESLLILQSELFALGLKTTLEVTEQGVAIAVCPASTEDVLVCSGGQVRRPETINYRTYEDELGGIFCPEIFGSERFTRRRRFGHLQLPYSVVSFVWRHGKQSALATILERTKEEIDEIIHCQIALRRDGEEWVTCPSIEIQAAEWLTGGDAIEALLKTVPKNRLPGQLQEHPELLVSRTIPVLPPAYRPLVLLDNGNFATSDLNDLYRRIINRANRLVKLVELGAPSVILLNERRMLQQSYDHLIANSLVKSPVMGSNNKPLVDLLQLTTGRVEFETKRVDWSGRGRVICSQETESPHILLPQSMFDTLCLDSEQPVLVTNPEESSGMFVALLPRVHDESILAVASEVFVRLGLQQCPEPIVVVHRPLGTEAIREAQELLQGDPGPRVTIKERKQWVDADTKSRFLNRLVDAALTGKKVILDSAHGMLLGGTGRIAFADDAACPIEEDVREVPATIQLREPEA